MFEIVTPENSQMITLNDNAGIAPGEQMIIANDPRAVVWALYGYAKRFGLPARRVGYAVRSVRAGEV